MLKTKRILTIIVVCIVLLSFTVCYASAINNITMTSSYADVASNSKGLNKNVTIQCYNVYGRNDVRMLDKNGNVVWESYGAIMTGGQRQFWCGSNVCKLQLKNTYWLGWLQKQTANIS